MRADVGGATGRADLCMLPNRPLTLRSHPMIGEEIVFLALVAGLSGEDDAATRTAVRQYQHQLLLTSVSDGPRLVEC